MFVNFLTLSNGLLQGYKNGNHTNMLTHSFHFRLCAKRVNHPVHCHLLFGNPGDNCYFYLFMETQVPQSQNALQRKYYWYV